MTDEREPLEIRIFPTPDTYGAQNKWMDNQPNHLFDIRQKFLNTKYKFTYNKLSTEKIEIPGKSVQYKIIPQCDLINKVDICIANPENKNLFDIFQRIQIEMGGQRFDQLVCQEQYEMSCAIFHRTPIHMNGKSVFPLILAPLHETNLVMPKAPYHDLSIRFEFNSNVDPIEILLFANMYFLEDQEYRKKLYAEPHEFVTIQSQVYCACKVETDAGRPYIFNLNYFNHPVYCIYLWGFDKSQVQNMKLVISGTVNFMDASHECVFYDGPIEPLEHYKLSRIGDVEPVVFFFGIDKMDCHPKSIVNFSRVDKCRLELTTTQDCEEINLHVGGYSVQGFKYMLGMVGAAFSK